MLRVNNIEVVYQEVILALKGVSLQVPDGDIIALLGSNGAGKTTTLKAISGLLRTEEGQISDGSIDFDGVRLEGKSPAELVRMGIAQVMEGRRAFEQLTVMENIQMGAYSRADAASAKKDIERVLEYFPALKGLYRQKAGYLSGGEQQMLVIGRALMIKPKLMLLDEPSLGLSPILVREIFEIIGRINKVEGTSILLVEQNAQAALGIAHYGYVMEDGKIVLDGSADKLASNEDIREFYFGLSNIGARKSYREVKHYKRRKRWLS
jgi:branched-chain amino acid transport system ATP-binding protein